MFERECANDSETTSVCVSACLCVSRGEIGRKDLVRQGVIGLSEV